MSHFCSGKIPFGAVQCIFSWLCLILPYNTSLCPIVSYHTKGGSWSTLNLKIHSWVNYISGLITLRCHSVDCVCTLWNKCIGGIRYCLVTFSRKISMAVTSACVVCVWERGRDKTVNLLCDSAELTGPSYQLTLPCEFYACWMLLLPSLLVKMVHEKFCRCCFNVLTIHVHLLQCE